jgi:cob(I)alamin adenosyltransferase
VKIYTKAGDGGETGLWGGDRVKKTDVRVAAYGDVDELNSVLGCALAQVPERGEWDGLKASLRRVQEELFIVGALLATPPAGLAKLKPPFSDGLPRDSASRLEREIDAWTAELAAMKSFIMPGGGPLGAELHFARAVCRRVERGVLALAEKAALPDGVQIYLNRLSDHLFTAARWANAKQDRPETPWAGLPKR